MSSLSCVRTAVCCTISSFALVATCHLLEGGVYFRQSCLWLSLVKHQMHERFTVPLSALRGKAAPPPTTPPSETCLTHHTLSYHTPFLSSSHITPPYPSSLFHPLTHHTLHPSHSPHPSPLVSLLVPHPSHPSLLLTPHTPLSSSPPSPLSPPHPPHPSLLLTTSSLTPLLSSHSPLPSHPFLWIFPSPLHLLTSDEDSGDSDAEGGKEDTSRRRVSGLWCVLGRVCDMWGVPYFLD